MNLPNVKDAVVSEEKITTYLLNPLHPDGAGKAKFFALLGFCVAEWQVLAAALQRLAEEQQVMKSVESAHGQKYVVDGPLETPSGRVVQVRTVWIVDQGGLTPRLVTAYPRDEGI